jgi:hypothetical protein
VDDPGRDLIGSADLGGRFSRFGSAGKNLSIRLEREIDDLDWELKSVALGWDGLDKSGFALIVGEGLSQQ